MKIALCLTGHVRRYESCRDRLFYAIVSKFRPDIFIHSWDEQGLGLNGRSKDALNEETLEVIRKNARYGDSYVEYKRGGSVITSSYFAHMNPKQVVIEKYSDVEPEILNIAERITNKRSFDYPPNFLSSQRKGYLCDQLRIQHEQENGFTYDAIIKTRFDIMYQAYFDIHENLDVLRIPYAQSYDIFSDIFAISNGTTMEKYCSFYPKVETFVKDNVHFNPHEVLLEHVKREGIEFVIDSDLNLDILR